MKQLSMLLIFPFLMLSCFKTEQSVDKTIETKLEPKIIVDKEIGDGHFYKEFIQNIKSNDCKAIQDNLDEEVYYYLSDFRDVSFTFKKIDRYLEKHNKFSICDLFFNSTIMQTRFRVLLPSNEEIIKSLISPRDWLNKSRRIRFIGMKNKEVDVAFFGGRYFHPAEPYNDSRDLDIWFRCPSGFDQKCFLYSITAY
ncbi:hypothetical protein [Leptospira bouyouniensis]|uniref:Lipoprotein n=1 Tax=Leptospira bouyouniensis TaxID=2484911 RepID=A0ABY2L486_9LEPT|nr:hypothetical protein [Leptospira bouyouniensis]TGK48735.1 hypothetical protein EHQ10_13610 [Leptospira bouyouniensis]